MNNDNTTFIEYQSKNNLIDLFRFIETYEYDDFLDVAIYQINIKCIKLIVKIWENSNEGHNLKYIIIYKIY
jgi:hypothetical protein